MLHRALCAALRLARATAALSARATAVLLGPTSAVLLAGMAAAETRPVEVPLVLPPAFLERLLVEQVFREPETTARIASGCSELVLREPRLEVLPPRLLFRAQGAGHAGFALFGSCYRPFAWAGRVEAEEDARISRTAPVVEFRVANSWLTDDSDWLAVPAAWDWVKPELHPRLESLRIDLGPLVDELRRALPLFATEREAPAVRRLVASLRLADARIDARGLVLQIRFEVDAAAARAGAAAEPEPPLAPEEVAAFEAALREWDAFLTFVVKTAGRDTFDPALRAALLGVLIDARLEIVAALAEPSRDGQDRVRALFASSWSQLQPALASLSAGDTSLRYLAFVASGDALAALDAAGPAFGFEISSDGLRRLARGLAPGETGDPLTFSEEVDPALRATFGFDAELPALPAPGVPPEVAPAPEPVGDEAPGETAPAPQPTTTLPSAPAPLQPTTTLPPAPAPNAALRVLDWLFPAAHAAPEPLAKPGPYTSPLDGAAPRLADLDTYLPAVATLLRESAGLVFAHGQLDADRRELFERLVLATAWQESCWRQYVRKKGTLALLRSSAGALGLMQVNPRVWRGFYAVDGLSFSIGYNARAGSEILLHYLRDYAIARGEEQAGGPDALARATYAVYNGGPSHLRRYRQPKQWRKSLVAIDREFHAKFREVSVGRELGVRECYAG